MLPAALESALPRSSPGVLEALGGYNVFLLHPVLGSLHKGAMEADKVNEWVVRIEDLRCTRHICTASLNPTHQSGLHLLIDAVCIVQMVRARQA